MIALSDDRLEQRLSQIYKAKQLFENNPQLVDQISELQSIVNNINQAHHIATEKVTTQRDAKKRRHQEEADRKRREWEAYQAKLKREVELKAEQDRLRQIAKRKEEQEKAERVK